MAYRSVRNSRNAKGKIRRMVGRKEERERVVGGMKREERPNVCHGFISLQTKFFGVVYSL